MSQKPTVCWAIRDLGEKRSLKIVVYVLIIYLIDICFYEYIFIEVDYTIRIWRDHKFWNFCECIFFFSDGSGD